MQPTDPKAPKAPVFPRPVVASGQFSGTTGSALGQSLGMAGAHISAGVLEFTFYTPRGSYSTYTVLATPEGDVRCYITSRSGTVFRLEFKNAAGALTDPAMVHVLVFDN